jgi:hypothetical protein
MRPADEQDVFSTHHLSEQVLSDPKTFKHREALGRPLKDREGIDVEIPVDLEIVKGSYPLIGDGRVPNDIKLVLRGLNSATQAR